MENKSAGLMLIMGVVLAVCIVIQHIAIFQLGYELSHLDQEKSDVKEQIARQTVLEEELTSPIVLRKQASRFSIGLASQINWQRGADRLTAAKPRVVVAQD